MSKYYISKSSPFIDPRDGKPTHAAGLWMERISVSSEALDEFSTNGTAISAEDIVQGLTKTINELVDERISYRSDGLPEMIESIDIESGDVVGTEEFEYDSNGLPESAVETTTDKTVNTSFGYDGFDLSTISHEVLVGGLA